MKEDPLTKYIHANQLASVMNNTKWRELADAMTSNLDFEPQVRVRYLLDERTYGFSHLDWGSVRSRENRYIEWMDLDPIRHDHVGRLVSDLEMDFTLWLKQALQKHSIPFSEDNGIFRIYGYLRPNGN